MSIFDQRRAARAGLLAGAAGTGIAAVTSAAAWHWLARRPLPRQEGTIELDGLEGPVRVRRDRWGVPHVEAESRSDLWFAQGFCHGQDRLWQMDFYRRVVSGRLSEMAGEEGLPVDRLMRTLGMRRVAEREAAALDPALAAVLERFCEGVNAAAASAKALPFEMQLLRLGFEPWRPGRHPQPRQAARLRPLDQLGARAACAPTWRGRSVPSWRPSSTPATRPPTRSSPRNRGRVTGSALAEQIDAVRRSIGLAPEASGSNNWAVSGALSATGAPLIAADPHLPPSMPGIWYQISLQVGERFIRGSSLPGLPGHYMGQNNDVCWTFTNVMADVQDLFIERIEGERYLFEGEWRALQIVREEIAVKGRAAPEVLAVRITHHGPIVNEALGADDAEPLALRWIALDAPTAFPGIYRLDEITSGTDLVRELEGHTSPASNLVWADRHGSIGYKLIGRLPRRRGGCPDVPKPGWSGEFEWEGTIPYEELPELVNPESGFLITANNRIVGDSYPHHITSDWLDGFRAARIEQLLRASEKHDLDGFAAMQSDVLSIPGLEVARRLGRLRPAAPA